MKKMIMLLLMSAILIVGCQDKTAPESDITLETESILPSESANAIDDAEGDDELSVEHSDGVVEISEKMFIAQVNDIYYNPDEYVGKTIKYEGIFDIYEYSESESRFYSVIRYGPGCCGDDGTVGFEVKWEQEYPKHNDWVEVVGVLEEHEDHGYKRLRIAVTSLEVMAERGIETVIQ